MKIHIASIILILTVIGCGGKAQTRDTVPCLIMVSDTTNYGTRVWKPLNEGWAAVIRGWEVRLITISKVDVSVNPNYTLPSGAVTLMGTVPQYENRTFYSHVSFLDERKKPLKLFVWMSKTY